MSIAEKLQTITENEQKVYDAGKKAEYDKFWDAYQQNGERPVWTNAFQSKYWIDDCYNPKYPINITSQSVSVYNATQITDTKVDIIVNATGCTHIFANARALKTIKKLKLNVDTAFSNWFYNNDALENIVIEGTIYQNIDFQYSNNLTHDSLISIVSALRDGRLSDNLISYPYYDTSHTETAYDATWTDNGDGSISYSGAGECDYILYNSEIGKDFSAGQYYVDLGDDLPKGSMVIVYRIYDYNLNYETYMKEIPNKTYFTLEQDAVVTIIGITTANLINYLEEVYQPKLHKVETVENLLPYPYVSTTNTDSNGITWTDNGDGSITVNGTAQYLDGIFVFYHGEMELPAGDYSFSLGTDNTDFVICIEGIEGESNIIIGEVIDNQLPFTLAEGTKITSIRIFPSGAPTFDNLVLYPSLTLVIASGTIHTCVLGSTNLAKLTDAEKATATEKGWTLA